MIATHTFRGQDNAYYSDDMVDGSSKDSLGTTLNELEHLTQLFQTKLAAAMEGASSETAARVAEAGDAYCARNGFHSRAFPGAVRS